MQNLFAFFSPSKYRHEFPLLAESYIAASRGEFSDQPTLIFVSSDYQFHLELHYIYLCQNSINTQWPNSRAHNILFISRLIFWLLVRSAVVSAKASVASASLSRKFDKCSFSFVFSDSAPWRQIIHIYQSDFAKLLIRVPPDLKAG